MILSTNGAHRLNVTVKFGNFERNDRPRANNRSLIGQDRSFSHAKLLPVSGRSAARGHTQVANPQSIRDHSAALAVDARQGRKQRQVIDRCRHS
jgi:hypothetical protein